MRELIFTSPISPRAVELLERIGGPAE